MKSSTYISLGLAEVHTSWQQVLGAAEVKINPPCANAPIQIQIDGNIETKKVKRGNKTYHDFFELIFTAFSE